jgi:hypothetical protein
MILIIVALMTWNIWLQEARQIEKRRHREAMARITQTVRDTEAEDSRLQARLSARDSHHEYLQDRRLMDAVDQIAAQERRITVLQAMNAGLMRTQAWHRQ